MITWWRTKDRLCLYIAFWGMELCINYPKIEEAFLYD
jgi:hypothetical protein